MRIFIHLLQHSFNIARGALVLALAGCEVWPANMACIPVGDSLQCWCKFGFGDCDNNVLNGCEVNTEDDSNHCGACGNACISPQTCFFGGCDCSAANCNCANFATDPDNCGSCGTSVDDGDPCTEDLCANGTPSHVARPNPACSTDGSCRAWWGSPCTTTDGCESNHCVDGVCCQSACNGSCEACSKAKNGDGDGYCRAIPYFFDPDDECQNGACDGFGQCTDPGTACATASDCKSGFCVEGVCCNDACTDTCMTCNRSGNVGTCMPVPVLDDDPDAIPSCAGPSVSCNGNGECKKEAGQTCGANSECLSGHCEGGTCSASSLQTGPLVWQSYVDAQPMPGYGYTCGAACPRYPWIELSAIVARADGGVMATGQYQQSVFGMPGNPSICDAFTTQNGGPDPFQWSIDTSGMLTSLQRIDNLYSRSTWSNSCNTTCWNTKYAHGPFLWSIGGDVGYYYEQRLYNRPHWWEPVTDTCEFGEFSKIASPQWNLGTADVCALQALQLAGDAAGNVLVRNTAGLTRYDPSGQVVQTFPDPFAAFDVPMDQKENPLALGLQGEMYIRTRVDAEVRLAKADVTGTLQWSKLLWQANDAYASFSYGLDNGGNILMAFNPMGIVDLGNGAIPKLGFRDLLLGKLDPSGSVLWSKRFGGPGFEAIAVTMRPTGMDEMALVLEFSGEVDLGDGVLQSSPVLVKLDAQGNAVWHANLATHFPFALHEHNCVLSGNVSGEVFVACAGYGPIPPHPNKFGCSDIEGLSRPVRLVTAKFGP